jgi:hypothetical protein
MATTKKAPKKKSTKSSGSKKYLVALRKKRQKNQIFAFGTEKSQLRFAELSRQMGYEVLISVAARDKKDPA